MYKNTAASVHFQIAVWARGQKVGEDTTQVVPVKEQQLQRGLCHETS